MCGLFGLMNGKHFRRANVGVRQMVQNGIAVNSLRGADSTGMFQRDKRSTYVHKMVGDGFRFIGHKESAPFLGDSDESFYTVVHNRAATEGKVTVKNAHPFEALDKTSAACTVGVHNGTLTSWKTKPGADKFEVDSEWAINEINQKGYDAFKEFTGAWCFIWEDDGEPDTLKFCRNHQRPLFFAYVKNQDRMFFASEWNMLTWLADRNEVNLEETIYELEPEYIYEFDIDNPRTFTKVKMPTRSYTQYAEETRNKYVREIVALLAPPAKTKEPVTKLLTPPTAPSVSAAAATGKPYVTPKEVKEAKDRNLHKLEVSFTPQFYDGDDKELWGDVTLKGEPTTAVIRCVPKYYADTWERADSLTCTVVGVEAAFGRHLGMTLILSRKVVAVNSKDEETGEELTQLGEAITKSMEVFMAGKRAADELPF